MPSTLNPRKPAWTVARRGACLRFGVRPNAFGNALGESFKDYLLAPSGGGLTSGEGPTGLTSGAGGQGVRMGGLRGSSDVYSSDLGSLGIGDGYLMASSSDGQGVSTDYTPIDRYGRVNGSGAGAVNADSIESLRQPDGGYRVDVVGIGNTVAPSTDTGDGWYTTSEGVTQRGTIDSEGTVTITAKREPFDIGFNAAEVDRQIINGSYDSFNAVGGALADFRLMDAWKYASYTPSQQAREAAYARVYPQQTLAARQLDVLANGGLFATAGYLMAKARGSSPEGQLSASTFGGGLDGVFGAFGGVTAAGNGNRLAFTGVQPGFGGISAPVTQASVSYGPSYSLKTKADGTVLYRFGKSSHGITADLTPDGVLSIEAQASTSMSMRSRYGTGTQMYNQMMEAIGPQNVKQINGIWSRGSGLTTNLEQFESNYALTGDKFGAAAQTWSGKRAEGYGFKPAIVDITPDGPRVIFRRP